MSGTGSGRRRGDTRRRMQVGAAIVVVGLLVAACSSATTGGAGSAGSGGAGTTVQTGSVSDSAGKEWPIYGHDLSNTRTNLAESKLTPASVTKLTKSWEIEDLVGVTGTPTVSNGVAYFGDWKGQVWAVKADTGEKIWTSMIGGMIVGPPAIEADALYASSGRSLFRLDKATGEQKWKVDIDDHPQAQINASPIVVDGLVLQGMASFENVIKKDTYTFRGSISAYDTATGEQKWKLYTTAGDDKDGPGGGVWGTPAVDKKRGMLYVGTGQSLAEPTSKMADSLMAVEYKTGKLKWSKQYTYPDVFSAGNPKGKDADVGSSPNLWTSNGRDLVGAGDKGGTYHTVDRDTGEVVWDTVLTPGSVFGGQIGSAAFVDGLLIVSSNVGDPDTNAPTDVVKFFGLDPATGKIVWTSAEYPGKVFAPVSAVPGMAFIGTDKGKLAALESKTGKEIWTMDAPDKTACGPSIVDGRLIWGYGFVLFRGGGKGGVLSLTVGA